MKNMLGKTAPTKKIDFLGEKNSLTIKKLTGAEIKTMQKELDGLKKLPEAEQGLAMQMAVLRATVIGAEEMTDEEFDSFPLDELAKVAKQALEYSGVIADDEGKAGNA